MSPSGKVCRARGSSACEAAPLRLIGRVTACVGGGGKRGWVGRVERGSEGGRKKGWVNVGEGKERIGQGNEEGCG